MVLSGVVLSANTRFGNKIVLQNLAHDIALTVRQAQVYGISVRGYSSTNFNVSYGMHFTLPAANTASTYELFGDGNSNGIFDASAGETVSATTLTGGYYIVDLCARTTSGRNDCGLASLNVFFRRPEPDACIGLNQNAVYSSQNICQFTYDRAQVIIESNRGQRATITIEASGQIAVQ